VIVVDTNVIAYFCTGGMYGEAAIKLAVEEPEWRAPPLWISEFRNFLLGKIRRDGMALADALTAMSKARRRLGARFDTVSTSAVLELSRSGCTAYDLEFVALAQELRAPLYTMDRQVLTAFPGLAFPLMPES